MKVTRQAKRRWHTPANQSRIVFRTRFTLHRKMRALFDTAAVSPEQALRNAFEMLAVIQRDSRYSAYNPVNN